MERNKPGTHTHTHTHEHKSTFGEWTSYHTTLRSQSTLYIRVRISNSQSLTIPPLEQIKHFTNHDIRMKKSQILLKTYNRKQWKWITYLSKPFISSTMCLSLKYASAGGNFNSSTSLSICGKKRKISSKPFRWLPVISIIICLSHAEENQNKNSLQLKYELCMISRCTTTCLQKVNHFFPFKINSISLRTFKYLRT